MLSFQAKELRVVSF